MTGSHEYAESAAYTLEHPERPALLIALHGLTGTRAQPQRYLEGFDAPGLGLLSPDLRAHGETAFSGRPEDFHPVQLAADVTELLRHLDLAGRPIVVLGISLGATVALQLVRDRVLDVRAAVFIRPAHSVAPPPHLRVNALIANLLLENPATALERLVATDEYRAAAAMSEVNAASLRDKAKPTTPGRIMRLDRGAYWMAFAAGERVDPGFPSLVVATERDPIHPVPVAREWHDRIQDSTMVTLPSVDADPTAHSTAARRAIAEFLRDFAVPALAPR
jgi:pimeloyl-ACP methyl ester carboxylesterase